jgi:hypothetical protein
LRAPALASTAEGLFNASSEDLSLASGFVAFPEKLGALKMRQSSYLILILGSEPA